MWDTIQISVTFSINMIYYLAVKQSSYCVAGSLANLAKLIPSKLVLTINNLMADLLIRRQMFKKSKFTKLFHHQTFLVYDITDDKLNLLVFE